MQVATKLHYTIDVFAANLLAVAVWRFYHHAVASERVKEQYAVLRTPSRTNRLASELWIVGWIARPVCSVTCQRRSLSAAPNKPQLLRCGQGGWRLRR